MPYKSKQDSGEHKGKPSEREKSKGIKDVNPEELERSEKIRKKYTDKEGNPDPDKVHVANKNRNTDKENIDKPAYGGSK